MAETRKRTVIVDSIRYYTFEAAKVPQDSNRHLMQCTKCRDRFVVKLDKAYPDINTVKKIDGRAQRVYHCPHGCKTPLRDDNGEVVIDKDERPIFVYAEIVPFTRRKSKIPGEQNGEEEGKGKGKESRKNDNKESRTR